MPKDVNGHDSHRLLLTLPILCYCNTTIPNRRKVKLELQVIENKGVIFPTRIDGPVLESEMGPRLRASALTFLQR